MTASELAHLLHGRKAGKRWSCRCPGPLHKHADRNRSLSVWNAEDGWTRLHCFAGCTRDDVLGVMGLQVRDLGPELSGPMRPEVAERIADERALRTLETRAMACAMNAYFMDTARRNYWLEAERRAMAKIQGIRDKRDPDSKAYRERKAKLDRFVAKYGWDRLWVEFLKTEKGREIVASQGVK